MAVASPPVQLMADRTGEQVTITETADGLGYTVTLAIDGFTASTFTSSHHLVEDKLAQLRAAIAAEAAAAYSDDTPTPTTNDA